MTISLRLLALAGVAVLAGCNPIEGQLRFANDVDLAVIKTIFDTGPCSEGGTDDECLTREVRAVERFAAGAYRAELDFDSRTRLRLKVADREIHLPIPEAMRIPRTQGRFLIPAALSGQALDVTGNVDTEVARSPPARALELCHYYIERWTCPGDHYYHHSRLAPLGLADLHAGLLLQVGAKHHHRGGYGRHRRCGFRTIAVTGRRHVEYFFEDTTRSVTLTLREPGSSADLGVFDGSQSSSQKVYIAQGACY